MIVKAAVLEVSGHGLRNFSMSRVAEAADVARATVYLRWPEKKLLILDALRHTGSPLRTPDTGRLRSDLEILVDDWAAVHSDPVTSNLLANLDAEQKHFPEIAAEYSRMIALPANRSIEKVLRAARRRGEVRADANLKVAARCLVGAIVLETRLQANHTVTASFKRALVDTIETSLKPTQT
ncbi:TetR-like C-terminal domain-containing protein [Rhodococcus triatomae]